MKDTKDAIAQAASMSITLAVVMIVLGLLAVFLPLATGIAVSILVAWLIVFSGLAHVAYAFSSMFAGTFLWRLLVGCAYLLGGTYLTMKPGIALASLTLFMASIFFAESVLQLVVFFQFRAWPGAGWIFLDSVVTFLLAFAIWRSWPASSTWTIGTLLGINLIVSGCTRLMYSV